MNILESSAWTADETVPALSTVAPLLRRRMSALTRRAVAVGLDCCQKAGLSPAEPRVVFASRHGEMGVTVDLLRQMAAEEPLSPTGFSNSVHHAAVGYWSLATANRRPSRAVAGGEASFCYGFLDALGMLGDDASSPVLLIAADDPVPPPFDQVAETPAAPYAMALLLASGNGGLSLTLGGRVAAPGSAHPPALDFLQWHLKGGASVLELVAGQRRWIWKK